MSDIRDWYLDGVESFDDAEFEHKHPRNGGKFVKKSECKKMIQRTESSPRELYDSAIDVIKNEMGLEVLRHPNDDGWKVGRKGSSFKMGVKDFGKGLNKNPQVWNVAFILKNISGMVDSERQADWKSHMRKRGWDFHDDGSVSYIGK